MMAAPAQPRLNTPAWECRECCWLLSAAQYATLRSLAAPCPDCGRAVASFRQLPPSPTCDG